MTASLVDPSGDAPGAARARRLLAAPGAWLEAAGATYHLRTGPDRRRRPVLKLDEAAFRALVRAPGLRPRTGGGWCALPGRLKPAAAPGPGRPGVQLGERAVEGPDGRVGRHAANLGESPLAWLSRRRGPDGSPFLSPAELAAGERLRDDLHRSGVVGRLTMSWDAGPRASGGRGPGLDAAERGLAAKARVREALAAVGPGLSELLERVLLQGFALGEAERELALPRRSGKAMLRLALARLAAHYRLG